MLDYASAKFYSDSVGLINPLGRPVVAEGLRTPAQRPVSGPTWNISALLTWNTKRQKEELYKKGIKIKEKSS